MHTAAIAAASVSRCLSRHLLLLLLLLLFLLLLPVVNKLAQQSSCLQGMVRPRTLTQSKATADR
jgi:hypothetical protein